MSISREKSTRQERCRQAAGLTHENLYSSKKNNRYRKKSAALPAAALPFARGTSRFALVASAAADRDWNRTARTFLQKFACHRSERLGGIAAASRSAFFIVCYVSSVYTFFMRNPCIGHPFLFTGRFVRVYFTMKSGQSGAAFYCMEERGMNMKRFVAAVFMAVCATDGYAGIF